MRILSLLLFLAAASASARPVATTSETLLEEARRQIVLMSGALAEGRYPPASELTGLRSALDAIGRTDAAPAAGREHEPRQALRMLDSALSVFGSLELLGVSADSARKEFLRIASAFEFAFSEDFDRAAAGSLRETALLFSTSVSCECTLAMCADYLDALYALQRRRPGRFNIVVVDAFRNTDRSDKYGVEFLPTLVLLDSRQREARRIVREEHIGEMLPLLPE
jgi:hypothetical protein